MSNETKNNCCADGRYVSIQQAYKKEPGEDKRKPVSFTTPIQAVYDGKTGASLEAILAQFNAIYVQYQGAPEATRNIIPEVMRRAGLTITYMDMESNTITERASSAVQKDNDHWGLDVNWSRVDELSLSGDISVSASGTWVINGEDTGIKAVGPKGDTGLTPWLKTIDNKLHFSYDNVTWEPCSENIAAWFRFSASSSDSQAGTIGRIQISRDNKTWTDLSPDFRNFLRIQGYVATTSALPANQAVGTIYGVGPTYATDDTAHANPIYRLHVWNGTSWVDNGKFTSIAAGVVQETGDSETEVMSQKAVTEKLSELGSKPTFFTNYVTEDGLDLNTFFKELYIEGLDKNINYCLRTFRFNSSTNSYQIDFGEVGVDSILFEISIPKDKNYGQVKKGSYFAQVVLNNIELIDKVYLFKNTQPIYVVYQQKVADIALSPYISSLHVGSYIEDVANNALKELYIEDSSKGEYTFEVKKKTNGNIYLRLMSGDTVISYVGLSVSNSNDVIKIKEYQDSGVVGYAVIDAEKVPLDDDNYYQYGINWGFDVYNLSVSPTICGYFNKVELEETIEKTIEKPKFFNSDIDNYIKELYIEGLDENTEYCLRTFGHNNTGYFQINIGTSESNVIEIAIFPGDNNYKYKEKNGIKVWVVVQNVEMFTGYLIFGNTDVEKTKMNKECVNKLSLSPYVSSIINKGKEEAVFSVPISFNGFSLPKKPTSLKILSVGNSFADQPLRTLIPWLNNLGIIQVTYGIISKSGGTLQQHYEGLTTEYDAYFRTTINKDGVQQPWVYCNPANGVSGTPPIKLCDALSYTDWDIITFQQQSGNSGNWSSIEPYLPKLIEAARYYCPNAGVKIAWQQTWAYANGYSNLSSYGTQNDMFNAIVDCSKKVAEIFGVDLIIPNGVVMQHLRSIPNSFWGSDLTTIKGADSYTTDVPFADFCEDGLHPNDFAEYCLGATFVQLLINSCFNKSIRNSTLELNGAVGNYAKVARQCVLKAVGNRFNLSDIDIDNILE